MIGKVQVRGVEELKRKLTALGMVMQSKIDESLVEGAEIVKEDAKNRVPVETGQLRDSIDVAKGGKNEARVGPKKEGFYGRWIERGKSGYSAHPFLRPALDENKEKVINTVKSNLKKAIRKML